MFRRTFASLARAALLPVRSAEHWLLSSRAHQRHWQPVLNGAFGDQLAAQGDARAIRLSFRRGGHDVPVTALGLSQVRQKTVVFVHGLMGDELIWQAAAPDAPGNPLRYGPRLAAEAGVRPLYVRFNSGRHISENGRALSALLTELVETYPQAVGELVLVGHSMGGLVVRSAGYYGTMSNEQAAASESLIPAACSLLIEKAPWLAHLRTVFLLGVPHEGSYLEQNSAAVERLLRRLDVLPTRLASEVFARRSNGIKDLGAARLVDEDWLPLGPNDAGTSANPPEDPPRPRTRVPLLPGVAYHVLVGTWLRAGRAQVLRDYFGDGLVGTASGQGPSLAPDEAQLPPGTRLRTAYFAAQHHTGLLRHAAVYQYLRRWL
ncbi:MAG: esterase/lipase family protein [Janthinobacterium lividum]